MNKLIFLIVSCAIATIFSAITTYTYGQFFQHNRYWNGTIKRVEETESKIATNLIQSIGLEKFVTVNRGNLENIFYPLKNKLVVEIRKSDIVLFTNQRSDRSIQETISSLNESNLKLTISRYEPPTWRSTFFNWAKNPLKWFSSSSDFITAPFISFLLIYLLCIYTIGYRYRSKYLSHVVLRKLKNL